MPKERANEAKWSEAKKKWIVTEQRDGKRKWFTSPIKGRKGKLEAERKADIWLTSESGDDMRFGALWAAYLAQIDRSGSDAHYIKQEQLGRLWLLPRLENRKVSSITLQMMQDCVKAPYDDKGLSEKTCKNVRGCLTALYRYAYKNNIGLVKPEFIDIPNGATTKERQILQPEALRILFEKSEYASANQYSEVFFIHCWRFIVVTGLRRGEAAGLLWSDIDGDVLNVNRSVNSLRQTTRGKNKNAKRSIVVSLFMRKILNDQLQMLKKNGIISPYVFPGRTGGQVNPYALWEGWATYRDNFGISCSIHELRHTMVSIVKSDMPEALIKQMVGHSASMDTLGTYGHAVCDDARRASDIVDAIFGKLITNKE